jgi:hypothetical protein
VFWQAIIMGLSFWANVTLGVITMVCGAMSGISLYFVIPATLAGIILLLGNIKTHETEKADFRKKIIREALDDLDLISDVNSHHISHEKWDSKTEESAPDLLGDSEYKLWKEFYDSIDTRNQYFKSGGGLVWKDFMKVNDQCVRSFLKIYDDVSWVRESEEAKTRITGFLKKAGGTASISKNLPSV